jgi:hypothetical protein
MKESKELSDTEYSKQDSKHNIKSHSKRRKVESEILKEWKIIKNGKTVQFTGM